MRLIGIICAISVISGSLGGCAAWNAANTTTTAQTATTLIVSAEKATQIGNDTIDTFLRLEYQHRAEYAAISPKIHEFAQKLRADANRNGVQDGIDILITARTATKSFKANRTAGNEANLRTAYATLKAVLADCTKYSSLAMNGPGSATPATTKP